MGYWVNTAYVNHSSPAAVSSELSTLFQKEGMVPIDPPPPRNRQTIEPMQYHRALDNDVWGVAIFPGADSWTVIQTAPLELLAEQSPATGTMRLAEVCRALSVSAFHLNVYDSTDVVLAEVSKSGEVALSGFSASSDGEAPFGWNGQRLNEELIQAQFQLHPFQDLIANDALGDGKAERIRQRLGGGNAGYCNNSVSVSTLITNQPFTAPGGLALYFRWSGPSRQRLVTVVSGNV